MGNGSSQKVKDNNKLYKKQLQVLHKPDGAFIPFDKINGLTKDEYIDTKAFKAQSEIYKYLDDYNKIVNGQKGNPKRFKYDTISLAAFYWKNMVMIFKKNNWQYPQKFEQWLFDIDVWIQVNNCIGTDKVKDEYMICPDLVYLLSRMLEAADEQSKSYEAATSNNDNLGPPKKIRIHFKTIKCGKNNDKEMKYLNKPVLRIDLTRSDMKELDKMEDEAQSYNDAAEAKTNDPAAKNRAKEEYDNIYRYDGYGASDRLSYHKEHLHVSGLPAQEYLGVHELAALLPLILILCIIVIVGCCIVCGLGWIGVYNICIKGRKKTSNAENESRIEHFNEV